VTPRKSAKRRRRGEAGGEGVNRKATCHYCGADLGCVKGCAADRTYWQLSNGCRACDPCLLENADDFGEMPEDRRIVALRLLHSRTPELWGGINLAMVDEFIARAGSEFAPDQVLFLRAERARVFRLHREGEYAAMMEAARALFSACNGLDQTLRVKVQVLRDNRRQAGVRKPRNRRAPDWHAEAVKYAKALLATGRESHELAAIVARRYGRSEDAVRTVLQAAGLVRKRKSRA